MAVPDVEQRAAFTRLTRAAPQRTVGRGQSALRSFLDVEGAWRCSNDPGGASQVREPSAPRALPDAERRAERLDSLPRCPAGRGPSTLQPFFDVGRSFVIRFTRIAPPRDGAERETTIPRRGTVLRESFHADSTPTGWESNATRSFPDVGWRAT